MRIRREEHMAGGNGHVIIKELLDAEQLLKASAIMAVNI